MPARPHFIALGLDHTTAGIETRERLAFPDAAIPPTLQRLSRPANGLPDQAAILSTCNRVELYGVSRSRVCGHQLAAFLARSHGLKTTELESRLYVHRDEQVAHHLSATAAGMRSLVPGEPQILGQIRKALEHALTAGTAGAELRRLFESAIAAGRRVRSGTAISRGAASVPHAGVELARRRLGTLNESVVMLIGTGDMAELAVKQLAKRGPKQLLVVGRASSHAERVARSYGGTALAPHHLVGALEGCDVVISATAARQPILRKDQLQSALMGRPAGREPLLVIDLAVPRNVDPTASELDGVEVYTVDDVQDTVERALAQRRAELPAAHAILESEVSRFTAWLRRREANERSRPLAA